MHSLLSKFLDTVLVTNYPVTLSNNLEDQRPQLQHSKSLESCRSSFQLNKKVVHQKQPRRQTTIHDYYLKINSWLSFLFTFIFMVPHQLLNTQQWIRSGSVITVQCESCAHTHNLVKSLSTKIPSQNDKINGLISVKLAHFFPEFTNNVSWIFHFHVYNTYCPTPRSRVLLEKQISSQLVKKFPAFYRTCRFITVFTSAHHLSLSWARSIQSMPPHPTSWRSTLKSSSHLCLDLPSGLFP
jgi:hypothetical protein